MYLCSHRPVCTSTKLIFYITVKKRFWKSVPLNWRLNHLNYLYEGESIESVKYVLSHNLLNTKGTQ